MNFDNEEQVTTSAGNDICKPEKEEPGWFRIAITILLSAILILSLVANLNTTQKWEYKVVYISTLNPDEMGSTHITINEEELISLGQDGWELVNAYSEMETTWPNFGNEEYVTGLQPNVRPQFTTLIFKRPK